jgi:CheY-like chemotaxis protein
LVARHVRGVLFIDYVKMLRAYQVVEAARAHLLPEDAPFLATRLDPAHWFPMESFERLGLALLREVVGSELEVIRLWGRSQLPTLLGFLPELAAARDPHDAVLRLSSSLQTLFDFPCIAVEQVGGEHAHVLFDYGMSAPAEAAAVWQTVGFFEELVTTTGGAAVDSRLVRQRLSLRWQHHRPPAGKLLTRPRVLLVDDERLVLSALRRSLARVAEVVTALSMTEALRLLQQQAFDAVVSDYAMGPDGDGLALLAVVQRRWPTVRRILHSGNPPEGVERLVGSGELHRLLLKPAPFDVLLEAVATRG